MFRYLLNLNKRNKDKENYTASVFSSVESLLDFKTST